MTNEAPGASTRLGADRPVSTPRPADQRISTTALAALGTVPLPQPKAPGAGGNRPGGMASTYLGGTGMPDRTRAHHAPAELPNPPQEIPLARDLTPCAPDFV